MSRALKWVVDRVGAAALLVLLSPLFAAIGLWILLESGRPVLLRQRRAGRRGVPFGMLKLRTMVPDALEAGRRLGLADPYGVLPGDPRITRSGRFLRRTSLDELPQLWNVLAGQMSLVGPRPDLVEQVANYTEADRRRLAVRPGITGWSQVHGREEIPWPERIEQDVWYVENWSLGLDLRIVLKTLTHLGRPDPVPVEDTMNIERARAREGLREVEPEDWDALLDELGLADVYLRLPYLEASRELEPGRPMLLHLPGADGHVVFASLLRDDPTDVTTPYGYGGPVAAGNEPPVERFHERYEVWCTERGAVSTFVRFHPLLGNQAHAAPRARLELLGPTVGWRLDVPDLVAAMHKHHRRVVRKALREGLVGTVTVSPPSLAEFVALYEETMRRNRAGDFYLFPGSYWTCMTGPLAPHVVLSEVRRGEELLASVLCLAAKPWLHYHLGGTSDEGRALGAANLVLLEAARWAQDEGFGRFHLGGGVGGRPDSLFDFKRRFCPDELFELYVGKLVHDEVRYRELSGSDELRLDGFFPAYRAT